MGLNEKKMEVECIYFIENWACKKIIEIVKLHTTNKNNIKLKLNKKGKNEEKNPLYWVLNKNDITILHFWKVIL